MRRDLLSPEYVQRRYHEDGLTSPQLATELNMSKVTLLRYMKRWGIERRKPTGRMMETHGYILLKMPTHPHANTLGYVREHRLVMEQVLGRYLEQTEVVHHKNGIRNDNRPENLELIESHSAHLRKHHPADLEYMRARQAKSTETRRKKTMALLAIPRFCECGCGEQLQLVYGRHKQSTIPRFKPGHGNRAYQDKQFAEWVQQHQGATCECGCGQLLAFTRNHFKNKRTVCRFIHGHNGRIQR